jgi:hypothetical protein
VVTFAPAEFIGDVVVSDICFIKLIGSILNELVELCLDNEMISFSSMFSLLPLSARACWYSALSQSFVGYKKNIKCQVAIKKKIGLLNFSNQTENLRTLSISLIEKISKNHQK